MRKQLVRNPPDGGRLSVMVPGAALAVLIAMGIGVDFSGQVQAEQSLRDIAGQCARLGTTQISLNQMVNQVAALNSAQACLDRLGVTGQVALSGAGLTVTVQGTYQTKLLGLIGIGQLPVTASAGAVVKVER